MGFVGITASSTKDSAVKFGVKPFSNACLGNYMVSVPLTKLLKNKF